MPTSASTKAAFARFCRGRIAVLSRSTATVDSTIVSRAAVPPEIVSLAAAGLWSCGSVTVSPSLDVVWTLPAEARDRLAFAVGFFSVIGVHPNASGARCGRGNQGSPPCAVTAGAAPHILPPIEHRSIFGCRPAEFSKTHVTQWPRSADLLFLPS